MGGMEVICLEQKETQETIITVPTVSIVRGVTLNQVSEEQSGKEISRRLGFMNEEMWRAIFICEIMIILTFLALIDLSFIR